MQEDIVKITNAVYRLLDYLPDSDSLKMKAKEKALAILENTAVIFENHGWISLKSYLSEDREKKMVAAISDITALESYLALARSQGWIGGMNFLIIKKQYEELKQEIITRNQPVEGVQVQTPTKPIQAKEEKPKRVESVNVVYSLRQRSILHLLQSQEKVQVADIIKKIPNITKRTVRRDMDDLLKKGAVVRMGEFNQIFYQRR